MRLDFKSPDNCHFICWNRKIYIVSSLALSFNWNRFQALFFLFVLVLLFLFWKTNCGSQCECAKFTVSTSKTTAKTKQKSNENKLKSSSWWNHQCNYITIKLLASLNIDDTKHANTIAQHSIPLKSMFIKSYCEFHCIDFP